jgi:beta-lactam-binding protein with PASTA domain
MPKKIYKPVFFSLLILIIFFLSAVVSYRVTISGEIATLPDLSGKTFEEVKADLAAKKLSVVQSGYQLHPKIEKGLVIFQDPPSGKKLKLNSVVKVIISAGREKVTVPRFVRQNLLSVNPLINQAGLRKGKISYVFLPNQAAGRIVAQSPSQGQEVARDSLISLLVSQGKEEEKYLMPDLLGRQADPIIAWLESLEFRVGDTRRAVYRGLEPGIIINQNPPQGYPISQRSLITLEVSK